ncbi:MAG: hypothetical protein GX138_05310 [Firmicutes bacterium]|nr:hypothetical protein [Bacillota bacterium]
MIIEKCNICPHACGGTRYEDKTEGSLCALPALPKILKSHLSKNIEPGLIGSKGSGQIVFAGTVLNDSECSVFDSESDNKKSRINGKKLAQMFLTLQKQGAANINLINPTAFAHLIMEALREQPLQIPVVYSSHGFDSLETLKQLDGLIDIYVPFYKYHHTQIAQKFAEAPDYPAKAQIALLEMYRQVGGLASNYKKGIEQGLLIRHRVFPDFSRESIAALHWLSHYLPEGTGLSLLTGNPYLAWGEEAKNKQPLKREFERVKTALQDLQMNVGYIQDRETGEFFYLDEI